MRDKPDILIPVFFSVKKKEKSELVCSHNPSNLMKKIQPL